MMMIDETEDIEDVVDIDETASDYAKCKVIDVVEKYMPEKCKTTDCEINIILKEDTPIYSRPRRLHSDVKPSRSKLING